MKFAKVLEYLHDSSFNRKTLGLNDNSMIIRWRFSDLILVNVLAVLYTFVNGMEPFERQFTLNDVTIQHPFAERERVNLAELFIYATAVPLATITTLGILLTKPKYKIYNTFVALLGCLLSILITGIFTDFIKNYIGRLRPDFLARCIPKPGTPTDVLVFAKDVCTSTDRKKLLDGFRTTPSGHSSLSFSGLFYLTLWLSGQLVSVHTQVGSWRTTVCWVPSLGALLIALSRTEDYRHHFVDVIIGSLIGISVAYWSYFRLFPSLKHDQSYYNLMIIKKEEGEDDERAERHPPYQRLEV
ncbi:diacylglycerol pyrophosphate phosphatase [Spathaspora passalidarum NRRL Y-27907]|uniref:Diacylglycerol pyrophosphate phosphatase n=1 Tax=Spathaspora passalidarum (strain NRRL Y-27907 / 11-Y1) TaxID=619300 RepID=G3AV30_SPAPN|nr:diacylglycerol pyrophosphate phosphatase [Spathaspora passalidarum NRRL Y-27907]EGW30104.1 diacylglycerol pyrophosphate phosphatase [Spathaspora passalidarum NRRL Y-27907]